MASCNMIELNLYAAENRDLEKRGVLAANEAGFHIKEKIQADWQYVR